jgi:hypothetical protein
MFARWSITYGLWILTRWFGKHSGRRLLRTVISIAMFRLKARNRDTFTGMSAIVSYASADRADMTETARTPGEASL